MKYLIYIEFILISIIKITLSSSVDDKSTLGGHETSKVYLSKKNKFDYKSIKNLIVFGDSLSSVNTNFTDMSYTGNNQAEGDIWPIILTKLNNMTLWDFAITGSVIDKTIVPRENYNSTFTDQCEYFNEKMIKEEKFRTQWKSEDSLFAYWLGNNDILNIDREKYGNSIGEAIELIVDTIFIKLNEVYEAGARNFLFLNVLALDESPPYNENKNKVAIKIDYTNFNNRLYKNSKDFFNDHKEANIFVYDIMEEMRYIMKNYKELGFKACGFTYDSYRRFDPHVEKFVWIDSIHPTYKTHEVFAKDINLFLSKNNSPHLSIKLSLILLNSLFIIFILL